MRLLERDLAEILLVLVLCGCVSRLTDGLVGLDSQEAFALLVPFPLAEDFVSVTAKAREGPVSSCGDLRNPTNSPQGKTICPDGASSH